MAERRQSNRIRGIAPPDPADNQPVPANDEASSVHSGNHSISEQSVLGTEPVVEENRPTPDNHTTGTPQQGPLLLLNQQLDNVTNQENVQRSSPTDTGSRGNRERDQTSSNRTQRVTSSPRSSHRSSQSKKGTFYKKSKAKKKSWRKKPEEMPYLKNAYEIESNITEYPKLENLYDPSKVAKFLREFRAYDLFVKSTLGLKQGNLLRSVGFKWLAELNEEGVDTTNIAEVFEHLEKVQSSYNESRQQELITKVYRIKYVNLGNIGLSMREYLKKVDEVKRGITLNTWTEKMFIKVVIGKIPMEYTKGSIKATQDQNKWFKWTDTRRALIEKAEILSGFLMSSALLRSTRSQNKSYLLEGVKWSMDGIGDSTKSLTKDEPSERPKKRVDIADVRCFLCNKLGHYSTDCPEKKQKGRSAEVTQETEHPEESSNGELEETGADKITAMAGLLARLESENAFTSHTYITEEVDWDAISDWEEADALSTTSSPEVVENIGNYLNMREEAFKAIIEDNQTIWDSSLQYGKTDIGDMDDFEGFNLDDKARKGTILKEPSMLTEIHLEHNTNPEFNLIDSYEVGVGEVTISDPDAKKDHKPEMRKIIDHQLEAAVDNKLITGPQAHKYRKVLLDNIDAFGLRKSLVQLSDLPPMRVRLKKDAQPFKARYRPMSRVHLEAMKKKLSDMLEMEMIIVADNPYFASPAFMVAKKNGTYRMVIDLRMVNGLVEITAHVLPDLENQLSWLPGDCQFFAGLDMLSGFDLLKTHPEDRRFFGISTPIGVYQMISAPMGFLSTPGVYQQRMVQYILKGASNESLLGKNHAGCLQWLDDSLCYGNTFDSFLAVIETILTNCKKSKVRLNLEKCHLIKDNIQWCGRDITFQHWNYSKDFYEKILVINSPKTLAHLETIVYLSTWLSLSIPRCAELKDAFQVLLLEIRRELESKHGKRISKSRRNKYELGMRWTKEHEQQFKLFRHVLGISCQKSMARHSRDKKLRLYSDASYDYWASALMVETEGTFAPIAFLSGKFRGSSAQWSVPDKELFAIVKSITRLSFVTACHPTPIEVMTDHKNLIYLFHPPSTTKLSSRGRLYRWVLLLQMYHLRVIHIPSETNTLADMLTRWGISYTAADNLKENADSSKILEVKETKPGIVCVGNTIVEVKNSPFKEWFKERANFSLITTANLQSWEQARAYKAKRLRTEYDDYVKSRTSFLEGEVHLPQLTSEEIKDAQQQSSDRPEGILMTEEIWTVNEKVWIPDELVPRLFHLLHVSLGHAAVSVIMGHINEHYEVRHTQKERRMILTMVVESCLQCEKFPKMLRRPLCKLPSAKRPNMMLHSDFLYMEKGYLLTLVDDFSRKVMLLNTPTTGTKYLIHLLILWRAHYGLSPATVLCTDRGSYYTSKLLDQFRRLVPFEQKFSIVYSPWSNGPAEAINKEIMKVMKAMISQYEMSTSQWEEFVPLIQHYINNKPNPLMNNLSPNQLFLGRRSNGQIIGKKQKEEEEVEELFVILKGEKIIQPQNKEKVAAYLQELSEQPPFKDSYIYELKQKRKDDQRVRINKKLHPGDISYQENEWVMLSDAETSRERGKLNLTWTGPYKISKILSNNVYEVTNDVSKARVVHACRIRYYSGKRFKWTEEIQKTFLFNAGKFDVQKLMGLRENGEKYELLVHWVGFEEVNSTWEPLEILFEDIPNTVLTFLKEKKDEDTLAEIIYERLTTNLASLAHLHVDFIHEEHLSRAKGWNSNEDEVLEQAVLLFGFGNWQAIIESRMLPGKTKSQVVSRVKSLTNCKYLGCLNGMRVKMEDVKLFNQESIFIKERGKELTANEKSKLKQLNTLMLRDMEIEIPPQCVSRLRPTEISNNRLTCEEIEKIIDAIRGQLCRVVTMDICASVDLHHNASRKVKERRGEEVKMVIHSNGNSSKVNGCLDSGATCSLINLVNLPQGSIVRRINGLHRTVTSAIGVQTKIIGTCIVDVGFTSDEIGSFTWSNVELHVVDHPQWGEMLLGAELLQKMQLLPWQLMSRRHKEGLNLNADFKEVRIRKELRNRIKKLKAEKIVGHEHNTRCVTEQALQLSLDEWVAYGKTNRSKMEEIRTFSSYWMNEIDVLRRAVHEWQYENNQRRKVLSTEEYQFHHKGMNYTLRNKEDNLYLLKDNNEDKERSIFIPPPLSEGIELDVLKDKWWEVLGGRQFDIVTIDPPWRISGKNPTNGVALNFPQITATRIYQLQLEQLQTNGFVFVWAINSQVDAVIKWLQKKSYKVVEYIIWVKQDKANGRTHNSSGYYLQHHKEVCIMARTPSLEGIDYRRLVCKDLTVAKLRQQSRKHEEFYTLVEEFCPNGTYLELFGRSWNLRDNWTTVGNETISLSPLCFGVESKLSGAL